jgi:hypothetical protein
VNVCNTGFELRPPPPLPAGMKTRWAVGAAVTPVVAMVIMVIIVDMMVEAVIAAAASAAVALLWLTTAASIGMNLAKATILTLYRW